jgi:flavin reductase (DIM6/NTAB) family NADH-FMN oxidoreductase RutF
MGKTRLGPITLTYPQPSFLVGANVDDKPNFLTIAWGGIANSDPPMVTVSLRHPRYTMKGIRQNMTFSVNIPPVSLVKETDYCGLVSGANEDKVKACRFTVFYGKLASAPMIEQCPVNLECRVVQILDLGSHLLVVGKIEETYISDECLTDGRPDIRKVQPFSFSGGPGGASYYAIGEDIGRAFHIGRE